MARRVKPNIGTGKAAASSRKGMTKPWEGVARAQKKQYTTTTGYSQSAIGWTAVGLLSARWLLLLLCYERGFNRGRLV